MRPRGIPRGKPEPRPSTPPSHATFNEAAGNTPRKTSTTINNGDSFQILQ